MSVTMDKLNNMEIRINLEKQNKRNDQVTELILDNCRGSQIAGLTDEFVNLEMLSMINVGLVTLKGFPKLPKLKKLELSDNRLTGGLHFLHGSPKLRHLNISGNRIKDFEALEPLKELQELKTLDLFNCDVTKADDYRKKVFELLPNLDSLDGYDSTEREVADTDESEDETSDVENRIVRHENEPDDDESGDLDSNDYDEEADYNGVDVAYDEEDDDEEDLDDDDQDDDDDNDDEEDDEDDDDEVDEKNPNVQGDVRSSTSAQEQNKPSASASLGKNEDNLENGNEAETIDDDDEDDDDDDLDDDDEADYDEEVDDEGSDLKQLEKEFGEGESEDDDDFEPTQEPDERDHEIDPEDDGDDEINESGEHLPTSNTEDLSQRGLKRKHEEETATSGDGPAKEPVDG